MVDPRILTCAHSFCLKCLKSTVSILSPKCPTCQIEFQIPEGGMEELKKNEFIEQLNNLNPWMPKGGYNCTPKFPFLKS